MKQVALALEKAVNVVDEVACELVDPCAEQHDVAHEPDEGEDLDSGEVGRRDHSEVQDRDNDVCDLVLRGDLRAALCCLMQRHGKAVYRYCRAQLRDPAL